MEKFLTLTGKYNTFSNTYSKARVYFALTGDATEYIRDLYILGKLVSNISINGSEEMKAEFCELNSKNGKLSMTIEIESDSVSIEDIARHAFDRTISLVIRYDDDKCMERVSNAFYAKINKTMARMSSALGMSSEMELKEAVDQVYGYTVPINSNMYLSDAEQLFSLLVRYAEQELPDFDISIESGTDGWIMKRLISKKCAICDNDMRSQIDGIPLCIDHMAERNATTRDKFKKKHKL